MSRTTAASRAPGRQPAVHPKPSTDRLFSSLFHHIADDPLPHAAGRFLCERHDGRFCYSIIGSKGVYSYDSNPDGLPRNCISVRGKSITITYLRLPRGKGTQFPFLLVPRGVLAVVSATTLFKEWDSRDIPPCDVPGDDSLTAVAFESRTRLRFIDEFAFRNCPRLTSFYLPASVEKVGDFCFALCSNLRLFSIERGSRLTSMGGWAFDKCRQLQFCDLPPGLEELSEGLFCDSSLSVLPLGSLVRVARIEFTACSGAGNLRSVLIPGSVVEICSGAFEECVSLVEVNFVLPSKLAKIGIAAFAGCTSLTRFRIVGSVEEIQTSFLQGSGVHDICIDADNPHFTAVHGLLLDRAGTRILHYFGTDCDVQIPRNVEVVCEGAFGGCRFLRTVTFESGSRLQHINAFAFGGCCALRRVQFGVPYRLHWDKYAFAGCDLLALERQ
jgi:hypothetical protein